jgi:tRNA pseudouridine synthase 10
MNILEKTLRVLEQPVCDHCLGRQFGQLLSGYGNEERGRMLRALAAMSIDKEKNDVKNINLSNFSAIKFHNLEMKEVYHKRTCSICNDIFENMDKIAKKIIAKTKNIEFNTFLVGTKLSFDLINNEESLWERVGIDYCEPLKAEINRELGKRIEKLTKAEFDPKYPDISILIDIESGRVHADINPLFIYGEYQKLKRGIPQTKWPNKKYRTSVEQIIAKPFMVAASGKNHKLHGMGREDIDARCLAWRPFVLEILKPKKRKLDLKKIAKKIKKDVRVRSLRYSNIAEVRQIKELRADKSYCAIVECDKKITKTELKKLEQLLANISQRTPERVIHRRADRKRGRKVVSIKAKLLGNRKFELIIRGEAGLYIKELISGDSGRTKPSVSEIMGCKCVCKQLDVIDIHKN